MLNLSDITSALHCLHVWNC